VSCHPNRSGDLAAQRTGDLLAQLAERASPDRPMVEGCPVEGPPAESPLERRPYLQRVGADRATIVFTARAAAGAAVVRLDRPGGGEPDAGVPGLRIAAEVDPEVPARDGVRLFRATFAGLPAATLQCYEVEIDGVVVARAGLRTAPLPASGIPVRFVVLGDSGNGSEDQRAVLRQIWTVPQDLVIHTGDLAYDHGTRAEIEANFFGVYESLLRVVPVFPTSGNHEYQTEGAAPYREAFVLPENGGPDGRERWYSFDYGDVHFVALDTERSGRAQAAWLDADLAANRLPWTVVYLHKPPYSAGVRGGDAAVRAHFVPLFEKHRVPLVLAGHEHHYERMRPLRGVTYVITGGGGRGTRPVRHSNGSAFSESVLHFLSVQVDGDRLSLHAIDATGREFDALMLRR
jgi:hypothetical protein